MSISEKTWQQGLVSQSACNLSGLAHFLVRLLDELRAAGINGTDALNTHPLVRLVKNLLRTLSVCRLYDYQIVGHPRLPRQFRGRTDGELAAWLGRILTNVLTDERTSGCAGACGAGR
jgi:hypothetical protein